MTNLESKKIEVEIFILPKLKITLFKISSSFNRFIFYANYTKLRKNDKNK